MKKMEEKKSYGNILLNEKIKRSVGSSSSILPQGTLGGVGGHHELEAGEGTGVQLFHLQFCHSALKGTLTRDFLHAVFCIKTRPTTSRFIP